MRLPLVLLSALPLLLAAPAAAVAGPPDGAAVVLAGAFSCAAGALLAFHLPTTSKREPRGNPVPLGLLAAVGGWIHAASALPVGARLRPLGLPLAAVALIAIAVLVAAGRRRGALSGPHRPTLLASGTLLLAGYAALAGAAAGAVRGAPTGELVAAWAASWVLAGLALVAPRLLKRPAPPLPLHLAALILLAVPATRAVALPDLPAAVALPAAAALTLLALAPAWPGRPERPAPLLHQADALTIGGLLVLVVSLAPGLDGPFARAVGLSAIAAGLTLLLAPILANQTPRHPGWARASAGLAAAAAVATTAGPLPASLLALLAAACLAWTASRLARPRRICPPEAVLPEA